MTTKIDFLASYDVPQLAQEWVELESRSDGNFFLSWAWLGCWLSTTGRRPLLIRASDGPRTVGLGFLSRNTTRRNFLSVRQLCLNETGVSEHDRLTIEHNGLLMARGVEADLPEQFFLASLTSEALGPWDELVLSGIASRWAGAAEAAGLAVELDRKNADYCVDLEKMRNSSRSWQAGLSSNLRSQFRQSQTFAERMGALSLLPAHTADEALAYFHELVTLHTARWTAAGKSGAFASDFSMAFHRALISQNVGSGSVEMLRLSAGNQVLGYLYNFRYSGTVSNYQSGFAYLEDNRHRPGLLAHGLAIEQSLAGGLQRYDFLAGDRPYKQRLGEDAGSLLWCRAQQNRPRLALERLARRAKGALKDRARRLSTKRNEQR